ncbi:DUF4249 domain-containing protein [Xanthovirga aplysinae]|uniref:DUF4249 domain-containing protein n=1 Tax=Xanthovirga aplysinae TaxID=2529853 RepID=UPI0012BCA088|nr:DUF4249 domain-containing protein [Xanthovirga aplysinae]MTI31891.1 DUF4249 domain-containing protein [Xanthovirga aplysinae]
MRQLINKFTLFSFLFGLFLMANSCQEVIDLEIPRGEEQLVVEGWITDQPGPYTVLLTSTIAYNGGDKGQEVSGATVKIIDDLGNEYILDESEAGTYQSDNLQGTIGVSYWLYIQTPDGVEYQSKPEELKSVAAIDEIYTELDPSKDEYRLMIGFQDPPGGVNYYQWKVYQNDEPMNGPGQLFVTDNQLFAGQKVPAADFTGRTFHPGALVRVEQMSLSAGAFSFFSQLLLQENTGNPLDTPPAPIVGNVYKVENPSEYALGYFGASAVSIVETVAGE